MVHFVIKEATDEFGPVSTGTDPTGYWRPFRGLP